LPCLAGLAKPHEQLIYGNGMVVAYWLKIGKQRLVGIEINKTKATNKENYS